MFNFSRCNSPHCSQRGGGFTQAGGSQRFGRAINFQIPTKLSAGIHPIAVRLRSNILIVSNICRLPIPIRKHLSVENGIRCVPACRRYATQHTGRIPDGMRALWDSFFYQKIFPNGNEVTSYIVDMQCFST